MELPDLDGRTALVTGAGRGIGRAVALALARCGARVIATARSEVQIDETVRTIIAAGGFAEAVPADVSREEDVRRLLETAGPVDVLINNASVVQPIGPVVSLDPAAWRESIQINLDGVFLPCRFTLPGMLDRGWGRIINVSSGAAKGGTFGWGAYAAAKAGVEALTKVLATEAGERGVRVNAVRPGIVDTAMQAEIRSSTEAQFGRVNVERYRRYKEQGTLRPPEHPARLILWLLTLEAEHLNGEILAIDDPEVAARLGLEPVGR